MSGRIYLPMIHTRGEEKEPMQGKGMFIWKITDCPEPEKRAKEAGLEHIIIRIASGDWGYNQRGYIKNGRQYWADDILGPYVERLRGARVEIWGYQDPILGANPAREAQFALARVKQFNLHGLVLDVEGMCKNKPDQTKVFCKEIRKAAVPLALSSYRYPHYHPEIAWSEWINSVQIVMPQVYWVGAHNPAEQLGQSYIELKKMMRPDQAFVPTGAAYHENGWASTPEEASAFLKQAKAMGLPGANFWVWEHAISMPGMWAAVANFSWSGGQAISFRERLAEYAHSAWSGWMKYEFSQCDLNQDGSLTVPAGLVTRWNRQLNTPYNELPEEEKGSDREEADKLLKIVKGE